MTKHSSFDFTKLGISAQSPVQRALEEGDAAWEGDGGRKEEEEEEEGGVRPYYYKAIF